MKTLNGFLNNFLCIQIKKLIFLMVCFLLGSTFLLAQNDQTNPWSFIPETGLTEKSQQRQIIPQAYRTLFLDLPHMQSILAEAPMWQTDNAKSKQVVLTLPMPDGSYQNFRILEAPIMHPDLAERYPMIKTYAGIGIDDPQAYLRFDLTQRGFHAMVRTPNSSSVYIDPFSTADRDHYISYYQKDFYKSDPWECHFEEKNNKNDGGGVPRLFDMATDCQLRTYTLALACTGEYAIYHGGTKPLAMAAMVTTMTRVNGIYENDLSVTMVLHPNNDILIFLDPDTDPYTNNSGSTMLGQNQTTCDNLIGNENYDVGHVFSTGGGGVATLRSVCSMTSKARGVTGLPNPVGDPFDVDYVSHEFGHQFGANHTQNNNCQRNSTTAMEPGSASTIMGYAGICSPNVQNNSDDYFHAINLQEMKVFIMGAGNLCSTNSTFNSNPTANAGPDYTIPRSTPFVLTGVGTDPNNDPLTYCWEQMDNQVATMPPMPTNTAGPAFRSLKATSSPSRYLPRLEDLVNNVSPTWEVLSSVNRTYNWRLTVRDNHIGGGCTAESDMTVTVSADSGPFLVMTPNTAVTWPALSQQTVTWDVANTTTAPVSCANVDIFLSLDGGFTYPITLASAVPNNGSYVVTLPNQHTTQARIMVKGTGNIFFDISNVNFTISAPPCSIVCPGTQTLSLGANCSAMLLDYTSLANVSDNCNIQSITQSPPEGTSVSDVGNMTVTLTLTDGNNLTYTCTFTVMKMDNTPPTAVCVNTPLNFNGQQSITLNANNLVSASDNCGIQSIALNPEVINCQQLGQTVPVVVIVTDLSNNTSTCTSQITVEGLPCGWSQDPNGINCTGGNSISFNPSNQEWSATSTNCFYSAPFNSDATAFAQQSLCGNGSITAQVTGITGNALGWAGVVMREGNSGGAKKAQLMTNLSNFSRREFRTVTNGAAQPQQFLSMNRYWLRLTRTGNQFTMEVSPNGMNWFLAGVQHIVMPSCIQAGLVVTNYNSNSTVTATFASVSIQSTASMQAPGHINQPAFGENLHAKIHKGFSLFPNPANNEVWVNVEQFLGQNIRIELLDIQGRIIHVEDISDAASVNHSLSLINYPPGMYLVKVTADASTPEVQRLIIGMK